MPHRDISLPPHVLAKLEAYQAIWQQRSPGIDLSGVITRMLDKWPWMETPQETGN